MCYESPAYINFVHLKQLSSPYFNRHSQPLVKWRHLYHNEAFLSLSLSLFRLCSYTWHSTFKQRSRDRANCDVLLNLHIWIEIETSLSIILWMTSAWQSSKVNGCQSLVIFGGICPLLFKWKSRWRFVCSTMPETGRTREARLWALSAKFSPVSALAWLEKGRGKASTGQ